MLLDWGRASVHLLWRLLGFFGRVSLLFLVILHLLSIFWIRVASFGRRIVGLLLEVRWGLCAPLAPVPGVFETHGLMDGWMRCILQGLFRSVRVRCILDWVLRDVARRLTIRRANLEILVRERRPLLIRLVLVGRLRVVGAVVGVGVGHN